MTRARATHLSAARLALTVPVLRWIRTQARRRRGTGMSDLQGFRSDGGPSFALRREGKGLAEQAILRR